MEKYNNHQQLIIHNKIKIKRSWLRFYVVQTVQSDEMEFPLMKGGRPISANSSSLSPPQFSSQFLWML